MFTFRISCRIKPNLNFLNKRYKSPQKSWFSNSSEKYDDGVQRTRIVKRVTAGILFTTTLGIAIAAKRARSNRMIENFADCEKLPKDPNYASSMGSEFFRYQSCVFPSDIIKSGSLKQLKSLELNKDDVIVASFPKSGTTWLQEIVYLVKTGLDFERAKKQVMESRFPYLEYPYPGLASIKQMKGPKLLKTHLPHPLLPTAAFNNGAKVIYIVRNPKDVAVSYYYFLRMASFVSYKGTFKDFANKFMKGEVPYGPYFSHVLGYWDQYNSNPDSNMLWLSYEQMHRDPEGTIKIVAQFLNCQLTDDQVRLVAEHTRFDRMARNPSVNYSHWDDLGLRNKSEAHFMRQGRVGDWQRHFDTELGTQFDSFIRQNIAVKKLDFEYLPKEEKVAE